MKMTSLCRWLTIATLLLGLSQAAMARPRATEGELATRLDQMFTSAYPTGAPGASVLVVDRGETVLRAGYGMAHLELNVAIKPQMVFRLGSITKQFTAVAVMKLVEEGKIELEAPIERYLSDYPAHDPPVTVEHLLTHSSGIPSYTGMASWVELIKEDLTTAELVALFAEEPLEFVPGSRWEYNNSGYFLLGVLLEHVHGKPYEEVVQELLFDPLEMGQTHYGNPGQITPGRVAGYHRDGDRFTNAPYISMRHPYSAGALLSSLDDLATWAKALEGNRLLSEASRQRMWKPYRLSDGKETRYGYGWVVGRLGEELMIEHGGGIHGFSTHAIHLPGRNTFVAVLSNNPQGGQDPSQLARKTLLAVLGQPLEQPTIEVGREVLESYIGVYRHEDEARYVTLDQGRLYAQRAEHGRRGLTPISTTEFEVSGTMTRVRFERGAEGSIEAMAIERWGGEREIATRSDEELPEEPAYANIDPALYERLTGRYELFPGFSVDIRREGDRLLAQGTGQPAGELRPLSATEFVLPTAGARIVFLIDSESGLATQLTLFQGGGEVVGKRQE